MAEHARGTRGDPRSPLPTGNDAPAIGAESELLADTRQLVFVGERSGEGYFDPSGRRMIFQAEREPGHPFYQQYLLDLATGDVTRLSTGTGKTTCGWFHPSGAKVLFASTHEDPDAEAKARELLDLRATGREPRVAFDYDPAYEIYEVVPGSADFVNLTRSPGYDAEGSWSPDGRRIVFASNRLAYTDPGRMSPEDREAFEADPSFAIDIYTMDADGGDVRRLTDAPGYDGGPFFSPDGSRIVWRRFDRSGKRSEIWTMAADGADQRPITRLGALSWAPFYHPSGDYVAFATNLHGFANFELYMVRSDGEGDPVRVTWTDGPDVLPVFTPDGLGLSWVNRRGAGGRPHIHLARWNDAAARRLLGLGPARARSRAHAVDGGRPREARDAAPPIDASNLRRHVESLASEAMEGRRAGTTGETAATAYVAAELERLGLAPAGTDGFLDPFPFTSGVAPGEVNDLAATLPGRPAAPLRMDEDWRPLSFSRTGVAPDAEVVFAGYGIVAPELGDQQAYDAYGDLDVTGRWALVLRYLPEDVTPERRQHLSRHATLRFKAMAARDRGAAGIVVASGPRSGVKDSLVPLRFDGAVAGVQIPAVSVSDAVAAAWIGAAGHDLAELQAELDSGDPRPGFGLGVVLGGHVDLAFEKGLGRNVVGRLVVGAEPSTQAVVVGAHLDHLGRGEVGDSLARDGEKGEVHPGADDNASGVAALLEIARHLEGLRRAGRLSRARRDIVLAAWSGEEIGLLGSAHHVASLAGGGTGPVRDGVAAYLNMDMVGRYQGRLVLQGVGSSPYWHGAVERAGAVVGLPLALSDDAYLPTDATSFYMRGVPVLSASTGAHADYHTPRDTPNRLDYERMALVAALVAELARSVAEAEVAPEHVQVAAPTGAGTRRSSRVYLGTVPDFAAMGGEGGGAALSGVAGGSPAERAGVRGGDRVVALAGQPIDNIYDYTRALDALKVGQPTTIVVQRDGERVELGITPGSRE